MKIIIIGTGYSGLATASFLNMMGVEKQDIILLEKSSHIGGFIRTVHSDGYIIETGPEGIRGNSEKANELIDYVGARELCVYSSNVAANRYLVHNGRLNKLPHNGLSAILTPLIPLGSKIRLLAEPFVRNKDIPEESSLSDLISRRFGKGIDHVLDAFISGVYAGDHKKLSASFVFPQLAEFEKHSGSIVRGMMRHAKAKRKLGTQEKKVKAPFLINFQNGMIDLVHKMAEGYTIHVNSEVTSIAREGTSYVVTVGDKVFNADVVIIATGPNDLPKLLFDDLPHLPDIATAPVAVVALGFNGSDLKERPVGYGYLSPSRENRFALGTLFTSDIFPHHAPKNKVLLRVILGGRRHPEYVELADETLIDHVLNDVRPLLNLGNNDPEFTQIIRHRTGIPQLELGHSVIDNFRKYVEENYRGIYFNAIGWTGISTAHLAEEAYRVAKAIVPYS